MGYKKIYICHTIYHIYITLCKEIESNDYVDIVISDSIPNRKKLIENMKKLNIIKNIYTIDEKEINLPTRSNKIDRILYVRKIKKLMYEYIDFDFKFYNDVYIYNDDTKIGYHLISNKIEYNLLEDGLNSFKIIDKYANVNYSLKSRILSLFNLNILPYGQSKYAKSIEVTSIENIKIPINKVKVFDNRIMIDKLKNISKKKIYNVFCEDDITNENKHKNKILILTQPLYEDKFVNSETKQKEIYKSLINMFVDEKSQIIIKPHPRDFVNYDDIFDDLVIINKNIPIEILNFNNEIKYKKVVTLFSTSVEGIQFADEKLEIGIEYIDEFQKI